MQQLIHRAKQLPAYVDASEEKTLESDENVAMKRPGETAIPSQHHKDPSSVPKDMETSTKSNRTRKQITFSDLAPTTHEAQLDNSTPIRAVSSTTKRSSRPGNILEDSTSTASCYSTSVNKNILVFCRTFDTARVVGALLQQLIHRAKQLR